MPRLLGRIGLLASLALVAGPTPHHATAASPAPSTGASVRADDLRLSIQLPPGPYFLGQTVPITTTLSNGSNATIAVENDDRAGLGVTVSGGSQPYYHVPNVFAASQPPPTGNVVPLFPGQSLAQTNQTVLTATGHLALTAAVSLPSISALDTGIFTGTATPGLFAGRLPTLSILVAPATPSNRVLHLKFAGHALQVGATGFAPRRVLYQYGLFCNNGRTNQNSAAGWPVWRWMSTPIPEPTCPLGTYPQMWLVLVTMPGYAATMATYCPIDTGAISPNPFCARSDGQRVPLRPAR